MPKLRVISGRNLCKLLAQHGFQKVRQKGSHIIMQRQIEDTTITIPVPDHDELKTGTLLGIIRQAGLPRSVFETK